MNTTNSLSNTSLLYNRGGYSIKNDSVAISANRFQMLKSALIKLMLVVAIVVGGKVAWGQTTITDVLDSEFTGITGNTYTDWSGKTSNSSAVYAGQNAGQNSSIQLRSKNNNSGIITTTSGGKLKKVTIVWNDNTQNDRVLQVYGKNTAYSATTDLYNNSYQGTLLGTIVYGTSTELTISGDYTYIGLRSADGAMYLTSISIDWEINSSRYSVLYDANGGTETMTDSNSPYASGATVNVLANSFTAPGGMDFNGWNTAADGSGTYYDAGDTFTITENTTLYAQWITSGCRSVAFSSMGYSNAEDVSSASIGPDFLVSFSSGAKYYNTGEAVRVYNYGTFTVSSTNDVPITSIRLTFGSEDGNNTISANTGTYSGGIWFGSALTVTFTVNYLQSNHRSIASIKACTGGVTLLYDANGGTGTMIDTNNPYTSGSIVTTMTNDFTAPDGMDFNGWNTAADGSGDYYAEGASFTITANTTLYAQWVASSDDDCQQITFSEQGYRDAEEVSSVTFGSSPVITATFSQGTNGSNAPKYYNSGTAIRAYSGNTITVSVSGFNLITSIRLIFGDGGNNNTITSDVGTYNSGVWSGSESSVTFTIGGTSGNRRIAGIRVCTARPTSATVTYDGNGATSGSVVDNNNPYDIDATVTVLGQGNLENECNTFAGWNTSADGSGTSYQEDDTFTITENVTLYAQWTPVLDYTITWFANGQLVGNHDFGCGSNINVAYVPEDASVTSAMCDGTKIFVGWSETEFEETNTPSATIITHDDFGDITVTGDQIYYAVFAIRTGSPETCTLITNTSTLTAGDSIVIVAESYNYAISTTQNNNNRGQAGIDKGVSSLTLPLGENVCVFELQEGETTGTWAFYDANYDNENGGYLYAASSSSNHLRTQNSNNANGSWSINITNGIATITAQGSNTHNILRYNSGSSIFSCYANGQEDVVLYKKSGGYTYSAYTTFCPCAYGIDGISDGDLVWAGKNANADWNSTINWTRYESGYHLVEAAPTSSNNVYIIEKAGCGIVALPHINENTTCNNLTMFNGLNIDIAENQTLTINGTATFTNGVINGNVIFGPSATVSGVSASSHVDGLVTKSGEANGFTFPTGSNGNLGKVVVTDGSATNVSVQYFSNPAGFGTNDLPRWWNAADMSGENPFNHVSNVEYWKISSTEAITADFVAEASTDMHFNSETAEEDRIPANIQMAFYDNNRWTNVGGSASISDNTLTITGAEIPASATRGISGNYTTFGSKSKSTVLPIELVSFTANCNGRSALIEWTTATEKNNDFFVLERSHDAVNFKEIARIAGAGNSIEPISYAYTDFGVRNGDNYYRLVQFDYDGTSTTSEIIVANCLGTDGEPEVLAYPNPFGDDLTLRFENFGNIQATVEVYDMLGRMVHTQKVNCSQNDYEVVLRLAGLSDGTYNVRISAKEFVLNRQVIKN